MTEQRPTLAGPGNDRRARFLTVGWNNLLTAVLGLPALAYAAVAFFGTSLSDRTAFIGMAFIGAVY